MNKEDSQCCICNSQLPDNTYRLRLIGNNVCMFCEKRLVTTEVNDEGYTLIKEKIKDIIFA